MVDKTIVNEHSVPDGTILIDCFLPLFNLYIRKTLQFFHLIFIHNDLLINNINGF
jgi:hypothetical protein